MAKKQVDLAKLLDAPLSAVDKGIPGMTSAFNTGSGMDKFRVRYVKFNLNEQTEVADLERLETRAIRNLGVYILEHKDYVFMENMYIMVKYLEEDDDIPPPPVNPDL